MLLYMRIGPGASYLTDVLPAVVVFGLGLTCVVAPVTATVLARRGPSRRCCLGCQQRHRAYRRLLAVAVLPAVSGLNGDAYTTPRLSRAVAYGPMICAVLAAVGGHRVGVRNDVLSAPPEKDPEAPAPGDCLHCGVEGPQLTLSRRHTQ